MSEEFPIQIRPRDVESSLTLTGIRSGLVTRGLLDAAALTILAEIEPETNSHGLRCWSRFLDEDDGTQKLILRAMSYTYGNEPNLAESIRLVRLAADKGSSTAQCYLGSLYYRSCSDPAAGLNNAEAAKWYTRAADQGHTGAQVNLADMYDRGEGVEQDQVLANTWYHRAAEQDDGEAQFILARKYDKGNGVVRDYAKAVHWYLKAASHGLSGALVNLGVKYDKGEGLPRDHAAAAKLYMIAADRGCAEAQFNLGLSHREGQGVLRDDVRAHMWLSLAASGSNGEQQKRYSSERDAVATRMTPQQIAEAQKLANAWSDAANKKASQELF